MVRVDTFTAIEEGIFTAQGKGHNPDKEVLERSTTGLRRFAAMLPSSFNGRLTVALFPDSQLSLRLSSVGQWVCVFHFHGETSCSYQINAEGCWARGTGALEHVAAIANIFGVPMRLACGASSAVLAD
jgi:hypothetical protein